MTRTPKKWPEPALSEYQLHRAAVQYLGAHLRPPVLWTTIDAGAGKMRARTARQRKNRGVKKGWPDILIIAPGPNVIGLELKTEKGEIKPEQVAMEWAFFNCKAWYITCRSIDDVEKALAFCKVLPGSDAKAIMRSQGEGEWNAKRRSADLGQRMLKRDQP